MRFWGSVPTIALGALILAAGLVVRAVATSQPGPLSVTDSADAYAIRGNGMASAGNTGVEGTSKAGNGVFGLSRSATYAGVIGTSSSATGYGVQGRSPGYGVLGSSSNTGVKGMTSGEDVGVLGYATGVPGGYGVVGNGFVGISGVGNGKDSGSIGVTGAIDGSAGVALSATTEGNGALAMDAYSHQAGGFVMSLDQSGNLILKGGITINSTPLVVLPGRRGARTAYTTVDAVPEIEDTGEGRIVSGVGFVAIDPALAAIFDPRKPYGVLVTPEGDCRGLYVTAQGPRGFYVRELDGGRSTVAFAYRIVGAAASANAPRLPFYTDPPQRVRPRARRLRWN